MQETKSAKKDAVKVRRQEGNKMEGQERRTEKTQEKYQALRLHYSETVLHKRKCTQHHSPATEETEIEKGKSEFAHPW